MAVPGVALSLVAALLLPGAGASRSARAVARTSAAGTCADVLAGPGPAVEPMAAACGLAQAGLDGPAAEKVQEAIAADPRLALPTELARLVGLQHVRQLVAAENLGGARAALDCLLAGTAAAVPSAVAANCPPGSAGSLSGPPVDLAFLLDPYAEAEELLRLGRRDQAGESARETLAQYPGVPVPHRVRSALEADDAWYAAWPRRLRPVVDGTVTALELAAVSVLVAFVLAAVVLRLAGRRGRRVLEFVPGLGWFLHLRVSVPPAQVGDASNLNPPGLAVVAAARLASPGSDRPSIEVVRDSGVATGLIASLENVNAALAVVASAGSWLLPGRTVSLEQFLHPTSGGGVDRVTVSLRDPGGWHSGTTTLSLDEAEADAEGAAALELVERGAEWAAFTLDPRSATSQTFSSHAEFLEGVRQEQLGNAEKASPHYRRALDLDPANHAAALNLYGRSMGGASVIEPEKLRAVRRQIEAGADRKSAGRTVLPWSKPPYWDYRIWYRLRYLELVDALNSASAGPSEAPAPSGGGAGRVSLVPDTCQFLLAIEGARRSATRRCRIWSLARHTSNTSFYRRRIAHLRRLGQLLDTVQPSVMLLLAAAQLREGRYPSRVPAPSRERFSRQLAETVRGGDSDPSELVAAVLGHRNLPAQASYNLACYFSALAERLDADAREAAGPATEGENALDLSLDALRRAYQGMETPERARFVAWAPEDPSLRHLRTERSGQFSELVGSFSPQSA